MGYDGAGDDTRLRGKVIYWLYQSGAEPFVGEAGLLTMGRINAMSPPYTRGAVCITEDDRVYVVDLTWTNVMNHITELDLMDVKWYTSIDEAIVRTMMELNGT